MVQVFNPFQKDEVNSTSEGVKTSEEGRKKKRGIILMNVGTPDAATPKAVKLFLEHFLMDKYVMGLPWIMRSYLVHKIIIPKRLMRATARYQKLWTPQGSPLNNYLWSLKEKLQLALKDDGPIEVFVALRYGTPSIDKALKEIEEKGIEELFVLPMYPQFASSTTLTSIQYLKDRLRSRLKVSSAVSASAKSSGTNGPSSPMTCFIKKFFYNDSRYIKAMADHLRANAYDFKAYDRIIFSYHSLPLSHVKRDEKKTGLNYDTMCQETTRLLAKELGLERSRYLTCYQSSMQPKGWLGPTMDGVLKRLLLRGQTKILVITPSFVADCLETIVEVADEYRALFLSLGGEKMDVAPCLNDDEVWVNTLRTFSLEPGEVFRTPLD